MKSIQNPAVAAVFDNYPNAIKTKMLQLRQLIFDTASSIGEVGELEETLKWGEPAYLTLQSGSGTTIRIDRKKGSDTHFAMYLHCQTDLIDRFRSRFPGTFHFEGNRAIVFQTGQDLSLEALRVCIAEALTYHRKKHSEKTRNRV